MNTYKLYAVPTWGSAIVETLLEHSNLEVEIIYLDAHHVRDEEYLKINPAGQIPALQLPSGEILTETLAICTYLNAKDELNFVPSIGDDDYPRYLRWSVFAMTGIYALAAFTDHPDRFVTQLEARNELREGSMNLVKSRFEQMERACGAPWFLGERLSIIDFMLTVMTFWEPGREWFAEHCPKIVANAGRLQGTPEFAAVLKRNEPTD